MQKPLLIYAKDAFESGATQAHAVLVFLVLYDQKFTLNGGCAGEDGHQTSDKPLQYQVRVVDYFSSILLCVTIVKYVNGAL